MRAALACLLLGLAGVQDLDALVRDLRGDDGRARRKAVQGLAALDTEQAWGEVLDALADREPMVADEAQLALRAVDDEDVLEQLLGTRGLRARDELVRERAAEALGHVAVPVGADELTAALRDREAAVRRAVARTVERRAAGGAAAVELSGDVKKLGRLLGQLVQGDGDPGVCAAALLAERALGLLDSSEAEERRTYAARSSEPELRAAAALAVEPVSFGLDFMRLQYGLNDGYRGVRTAACERIAAYAERAAAEQLVLRLEREPNERLRWRLAELLQGLSGRKHGRDPRPWREWVDGLDEDWKRETGPAAVAPPESEGVSAALAGLPLLSGRLVFLIDLSGSVWDEAPAGRSRKQLIDAELERALGGLPETTRFDLIVYTDAPKAWKGELVEATPRNVAKALAWFGKRRDRGKGDLWSALELGLGDPEVDTLVVLTDGSPSGGRRWNLGLMRELFAERNRFRRVALDAVLTDPSPSIVHHWEALCADSAGRLHQVSFE